MKNFALSICKFFGCIILIITTVIIVFIISSTVTDLFPLK